MESLTGVPWGAYLSALLRRFRTIWRTASRSPLAGVGRASSSSPSPRISKAAARASWASRASGSEATSSILSWSGFRLGLGQALDLPDQAAEAQRLGVQRGQAVGVERDHAVLHGLDAALQQHERRAQLVGQVLSELAPGALLALQVHRQPHEGLLQVADLARAARQRLGHAAARRDAPGRLREAPQRAGEAPGHDQGRDERDEHGDGHAEQVGLVELAAQRVVGRAARRVEGIELERPHHVAIGVVDLGGGHRGALPGPEGRGVEELLVAVDQPVVEPRELELAAQGLEGARLPSLPVVAPRVGRLGQARRAHGRVLRPLLQVVVDAAVHAQARQEGCEDRRQHGDPDEGGDEAGAEGQPPHGAALSSRR